VSLTASIEDGPVGDLGTILGIWAHPDDEVFLSGGVMAAARHAGQRVVCITATRGEHGTTDPIAWPPDRLASVRERELQASLAVLGVHEHRFLGIEDGRCATRPALPVVERLVAIIREVRPDTIVTFGPDGLTGHEDHQVVSRWATAARAFAAADADLLYATTTAEHVDRWQRLHDRLGLYHVPGLPLRRTSNELAVELRLDPELAERKAAALQMQASQTAWLIEQIGTDRFRAWVAVESFVAAETVARQEWPTWRPSDEKTWPPAYVRSMPRVRRPAAVRPAPPGPRP
jgi:LmbE family N-acetylglucosaminyl deacetylase